NSYQTENPTHAKANVFQQNKSTYSHGLPELEASGRRRLPAQTALPSSAHHHFQEKELILRLGRQQCHGIQGRPRSFVCTELTSEVMGSSAAPSESATGSAQRWNNNHTLRYPGPKLYVFTPGMAERQRSCGTGKGARRRKSLGNRNKCTRKEE
ncbi:unnamed protein product, partial [Pleuronectes platessa]